MWQVIHSQRLKTNIEENKTVTDHTLVVSSRFLDGLGSGFSRFLSSHPPLLQRGKVGNWPTVAEHTRLDSVTLISGLPQRPEILLRQGKVGTLFYHSRSKIKASHMTLEPGKHQLSKHFGHFECVPPMQKPWYYTPVTRPVRANGQEQ